ncbi:MAG: helix-turn-helix domain-containing protein [Gammaproteobacteria bacterium]|nr:helix-turn-helix domain-containing protein [Gammaproteobacteria bacterium]
MVKKVGTPSEMAFNAELGKRVRLLRKSKGMTQAHLARAVGVSYAAMCQYETCVVAMSSFRLMTVAKALGTTPDALLLGM